MIQRLATKGIIIFIGLFSMPIVNAASYLHRFGYNNTDNSGNAVLYADIVFNDGDSAAQQNTSGSSTALDTGFITSITFTYTPTPGGTTYTISGSDITEYRLTRKAGTTDYDGDPTLLSQLNNIQFGTFGASGNEFDLTMNATSFKLQANQSGEDNDFALAYTVEFPAPLPLLGILPAFSSIRRLKKRYNSTLNK